MGQPRSVDDDPRPAQPSTVRFPGDLHEKLLKCAEANGRGFSQEVIFRLRASFANPELANRLAHTKRPGGWISLRGARATAAGQPRPPARRRSAHAAQPVRCAASRQAARAADLPAALKANSSDSYLSRRPMKAPCPFCGGTVSFDAIASGGWIVSVDAACGTCAAKGQAPVSGVPVTAIRGDPAANARHSVALLHAHHAALKNLRQ